MRHRRWIGLAAVLLALVTGTSVASTVIGLSVEDQARLASTIVLGKVVAQAGEDHPELGIETKVTLAVSEVLKGSVQPGAEIVFYTHGGRVGLESSEAIGEATFQTGQPVLVFIEQIDGRPYVLGLSMGAWKVHTSSAGQTLLTRAIEDGLEVVGDEPIEHGPMSLTEMARRVDTAARRPELDSPLLRQTRLEPSRLDRR